MPHTDTTALCPLSSDMYSHPAQAENPGLSLTGACDQGKNPVIQGKSLLAQNCWDIMGHTENPGAFHPKHCPQYVLLP
jgi:hypothetical protein